MLFLKINYYACKILIKPGSPRTYMTKRHHWLNNKNYRVSQKTGTISILITDSTQNKTPAQAFTPPVGTAIQHLINFPSIESKLLLSIKVSRAGHI